MVSNYTAVGGRPVARISREVQYLHAGQGQVPSIPVAFILDVSDMVPTNGVKLVCIAETPASTVTDQPRLFESASIRHEAACNFSSTPQVL